MTALFMGVGYMIGGSGGMMIALVVAAATNLFSYWNADKMVLAMNHMIEVDENNARILRHRARAGRQCRLADAARLSDRQPQPNAFATGRNPQIAAVAATTGLLQRLSHEEVAAVMAHELARAAPRHADHDDRRRWPAPSPCWATASSLAEAAKNNNPFGGFVGVLLA